jgi:hypothetical protein
VNPNQEHLFPDLNKARYGDNRRRSSLFLPKYLQKEANDFRLRDEAQGQAHQIIVRWAELETSGKLENRKETTLQPEFLTEVFGQALGYTLFSKNLPHWNLEPQFTVNAGQADAAIGLFEHGQERMPVAVIELKPPKTNVDRDRFNGRTPVQQCWDYLNELPECPWGIVCNFVSFRLYHRNHTTRAYELFVLQDLRKKDIFRQFYYLFERGGFLPVTTGVRPRAEVLLEESGERQKEVGEELYKAYDGNRRRLIDHLTHGPHDKSMDAAIRITQKVLDRIVFVAFCEDRELLPPNSLHKAYSQLPPFVRVTNPRWQNFLNLFRSIDHGNEKQGIPPYNGGLFREDKEVDNLTLDDDWTTFFDTVGKYDFRDEVNVEVLGHLFEKSVNDIGRIRLGGLFDEKLVESQLPRMVKSAERKRHGIFYTPPEFTSFIAFNVVAKVIDEKLKTVAESAGITQEDILASQPDARQAEYWHQCLDAMREIKVVDPACGSGAFLIKAYDAFVDKYQEVIDHLNFHEGNKIDKLTDQVPDFILKDNLFGVDLSPEAVEITQLALWIRSAQRGKTLADLSRNIVCGNSLVSDPEVDPKAMSWENAFPEVFSREEKGFDCVIGNPPWERIKLQEREFFDTISPAIAAAVNAATRRKLIARLTRTNPELHERYEAAKKRAEETLKHVRKSGAFPLTGKGDVNTYATFAELAYRIVAPCGRVGILVPSGIATDDTTKDFFSELTNSRSLIGLFDFENKAPIFPDVHRSYKFCILLAGGSQSKSRSSEFVFFARKIDDLKDNNRKIKLSANDFKLLNPNTQTCPIFRTSRDAEITKAIYRRVPILVDKTRKKGGNPWGIKFVRMFDQTNDAELFHTAEDLKAKKFKREVACWKKGKTTFLPLYEAKMIQAYDHRAASVKLVEKNWFRQGQPEPTPLVGHQNPEYVVSPRWWADGEEIKKNLADPLPPALLAFKNVTSPTNQRTMIAAFIPAFGVINSAPIIRFDVEIQARLQCCLLANLNAFALDYVARQKIGNVNLNFFLIEQFPMFSPDFYSDPCPWDRRQTLEVWISDRVLKLTCTSNDMKPLAKAAGFHPPVHKWKPDERADLQAQLDAAYFQLYQIERDDVEYILSTFSGIRKGTRGMLDAPATVEKILSYYDSYRATGR